MNPSMVAAFIEAAGISAGTISLGIALIVAAIAVTWGGNATRAILIQVMQQPKLLLKNGFLVIRVLMIIMVIIYVLS